MREDMARVIVERPRIKAFKGRKGRRADFDDMPCREGMKRGHAWRGEASTRALEPRESVRRGRDGRKAIGIAARA